MKKPNRDAIMETVRLVVAIAVVVITCVCLYGMAKPSIKATTSSYEEHSRAIEITQPCNLQVTLSYNGQTKPSAQISYKGKPVSSQHFDEHKLTVTAPANDTGTYTLRYYSNGARNVVVTSQYLPTQHTILRNLDVKRDDAGQYHVYFNAFDGNGTNRAVDVKYSIEATRPTDTPLTLFQGTVARNTYVDVPIDVRQLNGHDTKITVKATVNGKNVEAYAGRIEGK